jgi:molecular chaperone GrpE
VKSRPEEAQDETAPEAAAPPTAAPQAAKTEAGEPAAAPLPGDDGEATAEAPGEGEPRGLELAPEPVQDGVEKLEALRRERDELEDQLLRRRADFENFRKRVERDRPLIRREVAASIMKALVPTMDNLDRALDADAAGEGIRKGVELTRRELLAVLEAEGVTVVNPEGERFDPERHQALLHEEVSGHEDGTIVEVFRKGYVLEGRLLRPALVKVAKKQETPAEGEPEPVH